jgi:uncharacterized membrane protein
MFATAGLATVNFLLLPNIDKFSINVFFVIFACLIFSGVGFLIRNRHSWVKYLLSVLILTEVCTGFPGMFLIMTITKISMIINILQLFLQIYALVLLVKIPKSSEQIAKNL